SNGIKEVIREFYHYARGDRNGSRATLASEVGTIEMADMVYSALQSVRRASYELARGENMEGAERELPLLRCVVFDGDEIASRVVGGIENVEKVSVNSITEMEDVVKRGGFVAVVHVGARLNSAEMARIVNADRKSVV